MSIKKPSAVESPYVTTNTTPTRLASGPVAGGGVNTVAATVAPTVSANANANANADTTSASTGSNVSYYTAGIEGIAGLANYGRVFDGANVYVTLEQPQYITYNQNYTGSGTVGGANGQVQFNNNGNFAGSANLTFNGSTLSAGAINTGNLSAVGITAGNVITPTVYNNGMAMQGYDYVQMQYSNAVALPVSTYDLGTGSWFYLDAGGAVFESNTTGNIKSMRVDNNGNISATGNITGNYFIGNGSQLTGISGGSSNKIFNGNSYANIANASGNVVVGANGVIWTFNPNGSFAPPYQPSNQRTGSGLTLILGDTDQQAIITGPAPVPGSYDNAPRLVVAGQDGVNGGEGGDLYLWAGQSGPDGGSGGDIKLDGGRGLNGSEGGTIKVRSGNSVGGVGGFIEILGGHGDFGGPVSITSGYGNSQANSANVTIQTTYGGSWVFDNYGNLTLPNGAALKDTGGDSVAFGQNAGAASQQQHAVAIGLNAGYQYQGEDSIAIGYGAGYYNQGRGVAIGYQAGQGTNQSIPVSATYGGSGPAHVYVSGTGNPSLVLDSVADVVTYNQYVTGNNIPLYTYVINIYPGEDRIEISQPPTAALSAGDSITFIGSNIGVASTSGLVAGARVLGTNIPDNTYINNIIGPNNIDISQRPSAPLVDGAYLEFYIGQGEYATAIGYDAGIQYQDVNAVAVGRSAGTNHQGANTVAVGYVAGAYSQGANAVAVGAFAGTQTQGINTVAIGYHTGANIQGPRAVAIGEDAGHETQGANAVSIGTEAGRYTQGTNTLAIGHYAGLQTQGNSAVALGLQAGYDTQGANAIAIGYTAGLSAQGNVAIAIGMNAGRTTQGTAAVAMGWNAGNTNQGNAAVAIGEDAGFTNQGEYSVAIGYQAGYYGQANNSIVLNASGDQINGITANSFTVKPVRNASTGNVLYYDQSSGEITFDVGGGGSANIIYNGTSNVSIPVANGNVTINANTSQWNFDNTGTLTIPGDVNLPLIAKLNSGGIGNTNSAEFGTEVTSNGTAITGSQIYMSAGTGEGRIIVNSNGNALTYYGVENPGFAGMVGIDPGVTSEYAIQAGANNQIEIGAVVGPITTTEYVTGIGVLNATGNINGLFANANVAIIGAGDGGWVFGADGNLTTPGSSGDISGANVVSAVTFNATESANVLTLQTRNGDDATGTNHLTQVTFGWNNSQQYPQWIATRHNNSKVNNAIDFYTGDGNANATFPANAILGGSITQGAMQLAVYANTTVRDSVITSPQPGMMIYVTGTGMQVRGGTSWNTIAGSGS